MKKRILLFTAIAGIIYLSTSSYREGTASFSGSAHYDCTGAETASTLNGISGCYKNSACHNSTSSFQIPVGIEVDTMGGSATPGDYVPGASYTIKVSGGNNYASGYTLPYFGFQCAVIKGASAQATPQNAGVLQQTGLPARVHYAAANPSYYVLNLVENSDTLACTPGAAPNNIFGGYTSTYAVSFNWTAPPVGTGTISVWAALCAVNGNNAADNTDSWNTHQITLTERTTSVPNISENTAIIVYPNPFSSQFKLQLNNAVSGNYKLKVYNLSGRILVNESLLVNGSAFETSINTGNWAPGFYGIQVVNKDGAQRIIPVIKQ